MIPARRPASLALGLFLAACSAGGGGSPGKETVTAADTQSYSGIGPQETVHFTGTEPFWGGQAAGQTLTYQTPDDQQGQRLTVERFAGRNGISFSGDLDGKPFVLAVTPGKCSDGMSDRAYPFTVTLQVRDEQRQGCAWTDRQPATGVRP
jgi:uncharacterized membrane protein